MTTKGDDELTVMLGMRISTMDEKRLAAIVERLPIAIATKHGVARLAIRIGLEAIERDPMLLLGDVKPKRGER